MKKVSLPLAGLVIGLLLVTSGCKKDNGTGIVDGPDVTFSITSQDANVNNGQRGITFLAMPSEDVFLLNVIITDPVGHQWSLPLQRPYRSAGTVECQNVGRAYERYSGTWRFMFSGSKLNGDHAGFEYQVAMQVGA
jgi:hypothetical protein